MARASAVKHTKPVANKAPARKAATPGTFLN